MVATLDPRTLVAYSLDEASGSLVPRKSSTGTAHDMTPASSVGGQGVPVASDTRGGWAVNTRDIIAGLTTARRYLANLTKAAQWQNHQLFIPVPLALNATGFAYGARFRYLGPTKTGDTRMFGFLKGTTTGLGHSGLLFDDNGAGTAGRIKVVTSQQAAEEPISSGSWTDNDSLGGLGTYPIAYNTWWRAVVRLYNEGALQYRTQLILYNETSGNRYRLTRDLLSADYTNPTDTVHLAIGSSQSSHNSFQGYIDDAFILNGDLSESEAIDLSRGGIILPREPDDSYIARPVFILSALKDDHQETRRHILEQGLTLARVPVRGSTESCGVRLQGFAPGRPVAPNVMSVFFIQKAGARKTTRP